METLNAELRRTINRRARQLAALQEVKICADLGQRAREMRTGGAPISTVIKMLECEPLTIKPDQGGQ